MHTTTSVPTAPRSYKSAILEALVVLMVLAPLVYFFAGVAKYQTDMQRDLRTLGDQASEVAGRARLTANMRLEELPATNARMSPVVANVVAKYGMAQLTPAGMGTLFTDTDKAMRDIMRIDRGSLTLKPNEPVPGLSWHGDRLYNAWNGTVTVYRKDELVLVAYTNVPQELCGRLRLGYQYGVGNYLFACNDDILVVEQMGSWHAAPVSFRAPAKKDTP